MQHKSVTMVSDNWEYPCNLPKVLQLLESKLYDEFSKLSKSYSVRFFLLLKAHFSLHDNGDKNDDKMNLGQESNIIMDHHYQHQHFLTNQYHQGKKRKTIISKLPVPKRQRDRNCQKQSYIHSCDHSSLFNLHPDQKISGAL